MAADDKQNDGYRAERDAALAEVARLRESLTFIRRLKSVPITGTPFRVGPQALLDAAQREAIAALRKPRKPRAALSPNESAPATGDRA